MLKKTIPAGSASKVLIKAVDGDLRVTGWDRDEVSAKTDGDVLDLLMGTKEITITCDSDLILSIPRRLGLDLVAVSGDADLRTLPAGARHPDPHRRPRRDRHSRREQTGIRRRRR